MSLPRLLLDPQGESGGSASAQDSQETPPVTDSATKPKTPAKDPAQGFQNLVDKHKGDHSSVAAMLFHENHGLREKNRELAARVPDGSEVISADDSKLLIAYRALGKPDDLKKLVKEHGELSVRIHGYETQALIRAAAKVANVNEDVLATLMAATPDVLIEVRDIADPKTKETTKAVYVKDGDAEAVEFDKFSKAKWPAFQSALKPEPSKAMGTVTRAEMDAPNGNGRAVAPKQPARLLCQ